MEPEVDGEEGAMAMLTVWAPIVFLIMMSGLFSGLTLGLLSLDIKQLEIVISGGDENERKYAKRILPTRRKGNWLLCTLLLGNVAVNAELSILLADMTSGTTGLLVSTALITIFGEILPQATCSRYGLVIGYFTVPIVWVIMAAFAPIAWPISFFLDIVLGAELGQIYTRDMFKQLMLQHGGEDAADFDTDEASMMCHVVELRETMVADIMTPLESVFSIEYSAKLDFELLARIMECGHSRIPVYNKDVAKCIVGLLFVKDLVLLNPDDEFRARDILHYYNHLPLSVEIEGVNCRTLMDMILEGDSHLVVCRKIMEDPSGGDNFYVNVGIITLEDVIAQLLGKHEPEEAVQGSDPVLRQSKEFEQRHFIDMFRRKKAHNSLAPNEITMIYQILISKVAAFSPEKISKSKVIRLLKASLIEEAPAGHVLYESGTATECFTLLLEGHVEITCGVENFLMEVGPWTPIASMALSIDKYKPDFRAQAREGAGTIKYLQISMDTFREFDLKAPDSPDYSLSPRRNSIAPPDTTSSLMQSRQTRSRSSTGASDSEMMRGVGLPAIDTNPLHSVRPRNESVEMEELGDPRPGKNGYSSLQQMS